MFIFHFTVFHAPMPVCECVSQCQLCVRYDSVASPSFATLLLCSFCTNFMCKLLFQAVTDIDKSLDLEKFSKRNYSWFPLSRWRSEISCLVLLSIFKIFLFSKLGKGISDFSFSSRNWRNYFQN